MEIPKDFYRDFVGIGVELTGVRPNRAADIERTLLRATSYAGGDDRRILGLLASWILVHGPLVCVGKLKRLMTCEKSGDAQIVAALGYLAMAGGLHEWKSVCDKFPERYLWADGGTEAAVKMRGPVEAFARAGLLLPKPFLRIRENDILPLAALAKAHRQVKYRLLFGANIRADAAFYFSKGVGGASELMRAIGCSYEPAHRILRDFKAAGGLGDLRVS